MSFPITKSQDAETATRWTARSDIGLSGKATDGSVYVYGKATTPEVDTDDQVVDSTWSGAASRTWFDTKANVRMAAHDPQREARSARAWRLTSTTRRLSSPTRSLVVKHGPSERAGPK